jgi:hypothetical protein
LSSLPFHETLLVPWTADIADWSILASGATQ